MSKRSLHVGLNDYEGTANDLKGCVNDAEGWARLLIEHYDFAKPHVRLLLDAAATKVRILDALKTLLLGAQAKDVLVFTWSSHGTYIDERGGDEATYDECMCPYDLFDNLLIDDELRELFANLPQGVRLTVIADSCFSGTVTRNLVSEILPGLVSPKDRRRVRFLSPAILGRPTFVNPWAVQRQAKQAKKMAYSQASMSHILLSGCSDQQYSYDAMIGGAYAGAMSYYALQAIRQANFRLTYRQLATATVASLKGAGYPQTPQLESPSSWKKRQIFV
jgi:metacaspase-1